MLFVLKLHMHVRHTALLSALSRDANGRAEATTKERLSGDPWWTKKEVVFNHLVYRQEGIKKGIKNKAIKYFTSLWCKLLL